MDGIQIQENQIPEITELVRNRLAELRRDRQVDLTLEEKDYHLDDGWLYLCVAPTRPGMRASDYADAMAEIEKELQEAHHFDNVLLVPVINEI